MKQTAEQKKKLSIQVTETLWARPDSDTKEYHGIAYIVRGTGRDTGTFLFKLVARNGEQLINKSQPYNQKKDAINTVNTYFPNFYVVDQTKKK